jgi:hypothetical protein
MERYLAITNEVLDWALAPDGAPPTPVQKRLFAAPSQDAASAESADRETLRRIARKAYRRPASEEELDTLEQILRLGQTKGLSRNASLRLVLKGILLSPQFLFITPRTDTLPEGSIVPLDAHHLASRLSYFLWASPPDAELSGLADAGALQEPATLSAQVRRLLEDPRSRALFDGFGAQWLGLDKLAEKTFDATKFPEVTPALRQAMYEEVRLLFEENVRQNHSLRSFLENDHTYLNGPLSAVYGAEYAVEGEAMRRVPLKSARRGGLLTLPGILACTSLPTRTSPVIRGVWVLEQILGEHVPPAPPDVPSLEKQDRQKVAQLTMRQRTELHRSNPVCANCHKLLDPIGFGLENFDAVGRWRDRDESGEPINPSGMLPEGQSFTSPEELRALLSGRLSDVCRSLSAKMLAYALNRPLEGYDEIVADEIAAKTASDGYRMQTLVQEVIRSYPFLHRRVQP